MLEAVWQMVDQKSQRNEHARTMYHVRLENSPAGYIYWEDLKDAPFLKAQEMY